MDPISVEYLDDWQGTAPKGGIMIDIGAHIGLWMTCVLSSCLSAIVRTR